MEITREEFNAINEVNTLLQQLEVKGGNNIFVMAGCFSRLQTVLQAIGGREATNENPLLPKGGQP